MDKRIRDTPTSHNTPIYREIHKCLIVVSLYSSYYYLQVPSRRSHLAHESQQRGDEMVLPPWLQSTDPRPDPRPQSVKSLLLHDGLGVM